MENTIITSIKDPAVVEARKLQSASYRRQVGKLLLYGEQQIMWAYDAGLSIEHIFLLQGVASDLFPKDLESRFFYMSEGILKKISGTNYTVSCMATASTRATSGVCDDFVVVMDALQDLGNIGSVVRSARGFSVKQFICSEMLADTFSRKTIDASRGSVFDSDIVQCSDAQETIAHLKSRGYQIVVTSPYAQHLQSQAPLLAKKIALVVGNETRGVSDTFLQAADVSVQIPMSAAVESLNVSVASGISIYELRFKQVLMMLKEKIFADLGRQVNVTGKLIKMAFDHEISQITDFSGMQVILMMIMHCDEAMTIDQISRDISLFGEELDAFLNPLLAKEYIVFSQGAYSITEKGVQFLAEIFPIVERTHQKILSEVTDHEVEQLYMLLTKVQSGCIKLLEK